MKSFLIYVLASMAVKVWLDRKRNGYLRTIAEAADRLSKEDLNRVLDKEGSLLVRIQKRQDNLR